MAELKVISPGLYDIITDRGRTGFRSSGIPPSGPMDLHSYTLLNAVLGKQPGDPAIEITLKGGSYEFSEPAEFAWSGGDFRVLLNDKLLDKLSVYTAEKGDRLRVGHAKSGCRAYVSVKGEWLFPEQLGSASSYLPAKLGLFGGRPLKKGDVLEWKQLENRSGIHESAIPRKLFPYLSKSVTIRILEGPDINQKNKDITDWLEKSRFKVHSSSGRMGIRLISENESVVSEQTIHSSPVMPGMIQLPPSGNPVILAADAQAVGGYPRIAKVAEADLWRTGQLAPGNAVRFKMIDKSVAAQLISYLNEEYKKAFIEAD